MVTRPSPSAPIASYTLAIGGIFQGSEAIRHRTFAPLSLRPTRQGSGADRRQGYCPRLDDRRRVSRGQVSAKAAAAKRPGDEGAGARVRGLLRRVSRRVELQDPLGIAQTGKRAQPREDRGGRARDAQAFRVSRPRTPGARVLCRRVRPCRHLVYPAAGELRACGLLDAGAVPQPQSVVGAVEGAAEFRRKLAALNERFGYSGAALVRGGRRRTGRWLYRSCDLTRIALTA